MKFIKKKKERKDWISDMYTSFLPFQGIFGILKLYNDLISHFLMEFNGKLNRNGVTDILEKKKNHKGCHWY